LPTRSLRRYRSAVDDLVARLRLRLRDGRRPIEDEYGSANPFPPATFEDVVASESRLGFAVAPLLRRVYLEVANGGFGPGYGLLGVLNGATDDRHKDAVTLYEEYRQRDPDDPYWAWPDHLLPVCHLGCAMYLCVDCSDARGPVVWFEPNPHIRGEPWTDSFFPLADSTEAWLSERPRTHGCGRGGAHHPKIVPAHAMTSSKLL
jgi:hypothetical protein